MTSSKDGVFASFARTYFELGFTPVPVDPGTKMPLIEELGKRFYDKALTEEELEILERKRGDWDLAVALGEHSGIVAIDFDFVGQGAKEIEELLLSLLPQGEAIEKVGAKGWTRFFKYDPSGYEQHKYEVKIDKQHAIDILLSRCITVLPPSSHKKAKTGRYEWTSPQTLENTSKDDLPVLTKDLINIIIESIPSVRELSNITNEFSIQERAHRFPLLRSYILKQSEKSSSLEALVSEAIDFDLKTDDKRGPVHKDKKYLRGKTSEEFMKNMCSRLIEWKEKKNMEAGKLWALGQQTNFWKIDEKGKARRSDSFEDFCKLLKLIFSDIRLDKVSNVAYCKLQGQDRDWIPIENLLRTIKSNALSLGFEKTACDEHLQKFIVNKLKPSLLFDIIKWDGIDYIGEVTSCLNASNIKSAFVTELFKEYMCNVFRRLDNPENQNLFIIMKGDQGIGKDHFITHLLKGFRPYFGTLNILISKEKDLYASLSQLLVARIPEFEETNTINIATIKSMTTQADTFFRDPYERRPVNHSIRCSFISSDNNNVYTLLRDHTGNRRFIIFDLEGIEWRYDHIPSEKLIAQAHALYLNNYRASEEAFNIMREYIKDLTPDDPTDGMLEYIYEKVKEAERQILSRSPVFDAESSLIFSHGGERHLTYAAMVSVIEDVKKHYQIGHRKLQSLIKNYFQRSKLIEKDGKNTTKRIYSSTFFDEKNLKYH